MGFAFWFDGRVAKPTDRGTKTLGRLVPAPERFRQSMFKNFALGIESLWAGGGIATFPISERTNRSLHGHFKRATGFALTLPVRRAGLGLPLECLTFLPARRFEDL
jgi:hypothetical protein